MRGQHEGSDLSIGVTGHRSNRVSRSQLERLTPSVRRLLLQLSALAARRRAPATARGASDHAAGVLSVSSALAEGADQHLAALALGQGCALHALLPFDVASCARGFSAPAERRRFETLIRRAARVTELSGPLDRPAQAYRHLGQALLDRSDLLLAVWDGGPSRGPGGTAEVVDEALRRHIPVIHLSTQAGVAPALLWRRQNRLAAAPRRAGGSPCDPARLAAAVHHVMRRAS